MNDSQMNAPDDRDPFQALSDNERAEYDAWSAKLEDDKKEENRRKYEDWLDRSVCSGCHQRMRSCWCNDYRNDNSSSWRTD